RQTVRLAVGVDPDAAEVAPGQALQGGLRRVRERAPAAAGPPDPRGGSRADGFGVGLPAVRVGADAPRRPDGRRTARGRGALACGSGRSDGTLPHALRPGRPMVHRAEPSPGETIVQTSGHRGAAAPALPERYSMWTGPGHSMSMAFPRLSPPRRGVARSSA